MQSKDLKRTFVDCGHTRECEYHSLLPFYIQDILRRAVLRYPNNYEKRAIYINDAIEVVKRLHPQGFKEGNK